MEPSSHYHAGCNTLTVCCGLQADSDYTVIRAIGAGAFGNGVCALRRDALGVDRRHVRLAPRAGYASMQWEHHSTADGSGGQSTCITPQLRAYILVCACPCSTLLCTQH